MTTDGWIERSSAAVVAVTVGFYWARVIKLVYKARRKHGVSAQLVPREPLGRALRLAWYPTVAVWAAAPWAVVLLGDAAPSALRPIAHGPWMLAGAVVAVACLAATMACWRRMGRSWRMGINPGEKTELVVSGPYAWVRHPIYALSSLMMLASVAAVPSPVLVAAAVVHLGFLQWEARREERNLVAVHGEVYRGYMRGTGRFVPRGVRAWSGGG